MTFERLVFLLDRLPRVVSILRELWFILFGTPEEEYDDYLKNLEAAVMGVRHAESKEERAASARRLSDLIARL